jgi:hypothetical protein
MQKKLLIIDLLQLFSRFDRWLKDLVPDSSQVTILSRG